MSDDTSYSARALPQLTGDDAPCAHLCYCERAGLIAEVARMREAKRMAGLIADERSKENAALRSALAIARQYMGPANLGDRDLLTDRAMVDAALEQRENGR